MKVLIIYGTTEGQTRKIARFMEDKLQAFGHHVSIADATDEPPSPSNFDCVIIGSSIHIHKFHSSLKNYIIEHSRVLNSIPSAFFSVSMALASDIKSEHDEVKKLTTSFLESTDWKPNEVHHIAGALKYTKYDFFKKLIMKMIAKKQGGNTDTSEDHEYTNWVNVEDFVTSFVN